MTMTKLFYPMWNDLNKLDLGQSGARPGEWKGSPALYMEQMNTAIFLRDEIPFPSFRMQAEVALPEEVGFIGFVFGARDEANYELVYLAPVEIQYDPVMNGSMTWQIYNGPEYQKPLPNTTGGWHTFTVEVQPEGAVVYLDEDPQPQLVIRNLQHGGEAGRVGVWNFLHSYIRNLTVEEIETAPLPQLPSDTSLSTGTVEPDFKRMSPFIVQEWKVSDVYQDQLKSGDAQTWQKAMVEENGVLNLNRLYKAKPGSKVQVQAEVNIAEPMVSMLSFGFSDHLRIWINDELVYEGGWNWNPPSSDGRIRDHFVEIPISWIGGQNTIRAEVSQQEFFGWGLIMNTGVQQQQ